MARSAQRRLKAVPEPIRKFRTFGSEGIYDDGTTRAGVYFELLRRRGVALAGAGEMLDLGSGFGGFPLYAARNGARVTAVDGEEYRLTVLNERLSAEPPEVRARVRTLKADAPWLPLRDASFDRAITIGVIEWVPLVSREPGDPRAVQVQTLREIHRVLRPGGTYVLSTKNRWYPLHVWREPQTRWPLVNALPRPAAQAIAHAVFGQAYRTYNHSAAGWQAMLREAGFRSSRVLTPVWGMHWPVDLLPSGTRPAEVARLAKTAAEWIPREYLRRTEGRRTSVKRLATTAIWSVGLEQTLSQGLVFIATA